jgi:tetratricopeptide (TPR) repeat protein
LFNLVVACYGAGEREKCGHCATVALPYFERHLKLHPDDEGKRVEHANLLSYSGRTKAAHAAAIKLTSLKDGMSLYNTACLFSRLGDNAEALVTFRKAIEAGLKDTRLLKEFLTDENEGIVSLAGMPEYEEVKRMVEGISEP